MTSKHVSYIMNPTIVVWGILVLLLIVLTGCTPSPSSSHLPSLLEPAITNVRGKSPVPLRVPATIPIGTTSATARVSSTPPGYEIDFYQRESGYDRFRGMISGSSNRDDDTFNTRAVTLENGIVARFRAISCGGSCAPVNLWWQENGAQYALQLKMSSKTPEQEQQEQIVKMANSLIVVK